MYSAIKLQRVKNTLKKGLSTTLFANTEISTGIPEKYQYNNKKRHENHSYRKSLPKDMPSSSSAVEHVPVPNFCTQPGNMEKFVGNSKEKFFYHNTLLCLVKALKNQKITVDLRNDSYVCGMLSNVDGFMNITLTQCVYCDPQGNEYSFDNLFVQGRNIRYIHIPETVNILAAIKNEVQKKKEYTPRENIVKSRKAKKALKQHMAVVATLE